MNDTQLQSLPQVEEFIKAGNNIKFQGVSRKEKYEWIEKTLIKFRYFSLRKKEKSIIKKFITTMTGYSDAQLTRLINKKKRMGKIFVSQTRRHTFSKVYDTSDIARLIETDNAHYRLSGPATKRILTREHEVFQKKEFDQIKNISISHIYNLRQTRQYRSQALTCQKTKSVTVPIGERRKPNPQGNPGFIRVDTVHQGDLDKEKGVYHINMVDEVTQWEIVGAVEKISEQYLEPLLWNLLEQFPFRVINFHSDNGSEYINQMVARLLNKLLVQQTKSRSRHCNDNALVEGKNGSVIRKLMGRNYIPQIMAQPINEFYQNYLNVYLNYHRPCGFATIFVDGKGKERKKYDVYMTPYEKLKSIEKGSEFLKAGISWKQLDVIAKQKSDNEFAAEMQKAKVELFKNQRKTILLPTTYATVISGSSLD